MQSKVSDHAIDSLRRFLTLLPRSADTTLTVLKIHLLVEEQIRAFIDERVKVPAALKSARLDCYQAICLAEALAGDSIDPQVWKAAVKLNRLRNDVAHKLEPAGAIEQMKNVCAIFGLKHQRGGSVLDDFSFAASLIFNEISTRVKLTPTEILEAASGEESLSSGHAGDGLASHR